MRSFRVITRAPHAKRVGLNNIMDIDQMKKFNDVACTSRLVTVSVPNFIELDRAMPDSDFLGDEENFKSRLEKDFNVVLGKDESFEELRAFYSEKISALGRSEWYQAIAKAWFACMNIAIQLRTPKVSFKQRKVGNIHLLLYEVSAKSCGPNDVIVRDEVKYSGCITLENGTVSTAE